MRTKRTFAAMQKIFKPNNTNEYDMDIYQLIHAYYDYRKQNVWWLQKRLTNISHFYFS